MSQSSVDLITELHAQWMQTSRARTRSFEEAQVLLQEARALLQDIEEKMDEAWRVFHEELKAMEDQRDASLPKEEEGEEELVEDPRDPDYEEPMPYEEPVPIVWAYDSEDDSDEEVDNEVELLNDDELLDIVW